MQASDRSSPQLIQGRLLLGAAGFLALYSIILTLSPAARLGTFSVDYRWSHWFALALWGLLFLVAHQQTNRHLPGRDPYLLPVAALLSGWGLLTIWRLGVTEGFRIGPIALTFGQRQALWLTLGVLAFLLSLRLPADLGFLRRYKYVLLTTGLLLTALTFLLGTNPSGSGLPRLWLGAFGVYLQPSEPLKLLLVAYLAGYLASVSGSLASTPRPLAARLLPLLGPTLLMTGFALLLLVIQRDLGTALIFIFLYAMIVYIVSGRKQILLLSLLGMLLAGLTGYLMFDVVRVRVDAWLNPWLDPSGRSYQIVQSLLAVANGGLIGRGPGLGSPGLVPVPHSDFIYTAIVEETGLAGAVGLLVVLALLVDRGVRIALHAPDAHRRFLAAGLTTYLVGQAVLIIGGNVRLLPLTGVTLPFMSYGGSSLLTSFLSLAILMQISNQPSKRGLPLVSSRLYLQLGSLLFIGLAAAALLTGWWAYYRAPALLSRTDNPRRAIADRYVPRGSILDRNDRPISVTLGSPGGYSRSSLYPNLSLVTGYNSPVYGQSGLEAALDPYLRGEAGNSSEEIWLNHLLYGVPPPGLNVRTTLDLDLQQTADVLFQGQTGALVLVGAHTGEVLAMVSQPGFDANQLEEAWPALSTDDRAPLLNRATLGQYASGPALGPLLLAGGFARGELPELPGRFDATAETPAGQIRLNCAGLPAGNTWGAAIAAGCPAPVETLAQALAPPASSTQWDLFRNAGLNTTPALRLPVVEAQLLDDREPSRLAFGLADFQVSPLQMVLAVASLSADGVRPAPVIVSAIKDPRLGWTDLPALDQPVQALPAEAARRAAVELAVPDLSIWQAVATVPNTPDETITWYLAGTLPVIGEESFALVVLLENDDARQAVAIGQAVLAAAMEP